VLLIAHMTQSMIEFAADGSHDPLMSVSHDHCIVV